MDTLYNIFMISSILIGFVLLLPGALGILIWYMLYKIDIKYSDPHSLTWFKIKREDDTPIMQPYSFSDSYSVLLCPICEGKGVVKGEDA